MNEMVKTKFEAACIFFDTASIMGYEPTITICHKNGTEINIKWKDYKRIVVEIVRSMKDVNASCAECVEMMEKLEDA